MNDQYTLNGATFLDKNDKLSGYRDQFQITEDHVIYLDGNSLGRLPSKAIEILDRAVRYQWGERLIRSWNEDWYLKNRVIGDKIAQIAGAKKGEVIVTDTTSVNLYKLAYSALKLRPGRTKIITDDLNFPSDLYILQGIVKEFGEDCTLEIIQSQDGISVDLDAVKAAVDENTALVSFSHVAFKSSFRYPMSKVTKLVQDKGAMMLWDLSHSIGAVPGELNQSNADMAVGCTYKYLNGGPGSPAFLYVRKDLQEELISPVWGWFGQRDPFEFDLQYTPAEGILKYQAGTPPLLSLSAIEPTLDMMIEIGMDQIRRKSELQSEYLLGLVNKFLIPLGFILGSPRNIDERGSHISIKHKEAYRICKALIDPSVGENVVIPDFRDPDNIRIGITPLYTSFEEIFKAIKQIQMIVSEKKYKHFSDAREEVT